MCGLVASHLRLLLQLVVPVVLSTVAVADVIAAACPSAPSAPAAPVSPFSPFKLVKANANVRADSVPPKLTSTPGTPTLLSTVAEADVMVALVPAAPVSP